MHAQDHGVSQPKHGHLIETPIGMHHVVKKKVSEEHEKRWNQCQHLATKRLYLIQHTYGCQKLGGLLV